MHVASRRSFRPQGLFLPVVGAIGALHGCAAEPDAPRATAHLSHSEQGAVAQMVIVSPRALTIQANTFEGSLQGHSAIDVDRQGRALVVWDSRRQQEGSPGVYAQLFSGEGAPIGGELEVNLYKRNAQSDPAAAWASDGAAWVVWNSHGQDGNGMGVIARRFESGFASGSPEIAVNSTREGDQVSPVIAAGPNGTVLVAWVSSRGFEPARLHARIFGPDGMPLSDELEIEPGLEIRQTFPSIASLPASCGAAYLLAWAESDHAEGVARSVRAVRLSASGDAVGDVISVSSSSDGGAGIEPSVATDGTGRFVVSWMIQDGERYRPRARWFDSQGRAVTAAVEVAEADRSFKSGIAACMALDGRTTFAYNADAPEAEIASVDGRERIVLAEYEFGGTPVSGPRRVHDVVMPGQKLGVSGAKRLASGANGAVALAWSGNAGNSDSSAANLTLLSVTGAATPTALRSDSQQQPQVALPDPTHTPPAFDPEFRAPAEPWPTQRGAVDFGFEAVPGTGWTPPDPEIAVGPDHIVVMVNGQIAFFDKNGTNLFRDEIESNFGFWGALGAGGFVFDPECLYDTHANRFMAMACERTGGRSFFLFAVSDDSNPVGVWHKYRFDVTDRNPSGDTLNDIDSPQLSVDRDVVYLSADFFSPDKYLVYMVEKAPLLSGGANPTVRSLVVTGQQSFGFPITYDANAAAQYIIESMEGAGSTHTTMRFHAITNPLTTPARVTTTLAVPGYRYPNPPVQQGSSVRPTVFEPRFWSCTYRNGSLWAVHHMRNTTSEVTRARWYQFDMRGWPASGNTPTLVQSGDIAPGANVYVTFPSIAVDSANNAAVTFSRSASNEFFSMSRAVRSYNDPPGTLRAPEVVKQSGAAETSGRWGDYSGTKHDPMTCGVFWGHNEWTPNGSWRTWVGRYAIPNPADFNSDGFVNGIDFDLYVEAYEAGLPTSDFDGDGFVTGVDFDLYVLAFEATC